MIKAMQLKAKKELQESATVPDKKIHLPEFQTPHLPKHQIAAMLMENLKNFFSMRIKLKAPQVQNLNILTLLNITRKLGMQIKQNSILV